MHANDLFKAVMELDLNPIKMKLMHVESGEGWSLEKATAVEKEYRRFLCLMKLYPEEDTAPLVDVDTFWHYHILDTMKYAKDCEQVFGYFLHHYPYVGMRGEDDEQFRLDSGNRMQELYEATFGESYPGAVSEDLQAAAYCAGPANEKAGAIHVAAISTFRADAAAKTAYCAGPANIAYCAGPAAKSAKRPAAETAYCAGPANIAYCAGPAAKSAKRPAANTAYCAGPANIAYCAGPAARKAGFDGSAREPGSCYPSTGARHSVGTPAPARLSA